MLCSGRQTGLRRSPICVSLQTSCASERNTCSQQVPMIQAVRQKYLQKTYNSGYSLMVTHLTTKPPVRCLNRAERTGSLVVSWSVTTNVLNFTVSGSDGAGNGLPGSRTLTLPSSSPCTATHTIVRGTIIAVPRTHPKSSLKARTSFYP
jgi:hypothetical protein